VQVDAQSSKLFKWLCKKAFASSEQPIIIFLSYLIHTDSQPCIVELVLEDCSHWPTPLLYSKVLLVAVFAHWLLLPIYADWNLNPKSKI
jgi:hypothetical protein